MEAPTSRRDLLRRGAVGAGAAIAGAAAMRAASASATPDKPNIIVLMCDQERFPMWTPKLPLPAREWLDARGVSFERFYHSAVPCSPSRSVFWTGLSTTQSGIFGNFLQGYQYSMDPSIPTVGDLMREQGYTTAFFGKWHLSFVGPNPQDVDAAGLADEARTDYLGPYGFDFSAPTFALEPANFRDGLTNDPIWASQTVNFIKQQASASKPFFAVMSLLNPHDISYYPRGFTADFQRPDWQPKLPLNFYDDPKTKPYIHEQYHKGLNQVAGSFDSEDKNAWLRLLNIYCDLIVGTDTYLADVFKALSDTGKLDDTVIIRTADHGELGASHKLRGKGPTMYEEQVRMPLVVSYPKRFARNARTPALAEAVDLTPTCLELAGLSDPISKYPFLRGKSLVPILDNPDRGGVRDAALCCCDENWSVTEQWGVGQSWKKHMRALLTPRFKFARYYAMSASKIAGQAPILHLDDQDFELYDLREDPYELRNLANDPAYKPLLADLHAWQLDLEKHRYDKVELPAKGGHSIVEELFGANPVGNPQIPGVSSGPSDPPDVRTGGPGFYLQVPVEDPGLGDLIYEASGGTTQSRAAKVREAARARAEARARLRATMLCDLEPHPTAPTALTGGGA
jgi:arylsulfatase